jgi:hypothetical protein
MNRLRNTLETIVFLIVAASLYGSLFVLHDYPRISRRPWLARLQEAFWLAVSWLVGLYLLAWTAGWLAWDLIKQGRKP